MGSSIEQFVQRLTESGLMSLADVQSFRDTLPADRKPTDAEALVWELVQANRLTKYQAKAVFEGQTKGLVFDEYVVLDKLGQGGMGVVLKAKHRRMDRVVAIKTLPPAAMNAPENVQRFYREVQAAAKLSHPNIVAAYDAREFDGVHCLIMEYVEGKDLARLVHRHGPMPVSQAVDCVLQAARGLQYAHEQGVVHRDIKPGNLLLDKRGTVKILDMGLARIIGTEALMGGPERLTTTGQVMGTCDYMAPEQAESTHAADHRADIYSLGCTLYKLLANKPLYTGDTVIQILLAHREAPIPSLCAARSDAPPRLDAIFQKMVAKRASDRQQSMAEVIGELEGFLRSLSGPVVARLAQAPSDSALPASLAFLQDEAPVAMATRQKKAVVTDDTFQRADREDTTGILTKARRAIAAARSRPLIIASAAAGVVTVVLVLGLAFSLIGGQGPAQKLAEAVKEQKEEITPGEEVRQETPSPIQPKADEPPREAAKSTPTPPPPAAAPFDAATARKHQEAWAKHLGVPVEMTNSIGMKFVLIPPGEFDMGSTPEEIARELSEAKQRKEEKWYLDSIATEGPRHRVRLTKAFYLGMNEVTQGQYQQVMGTNPSSFSAQGTASRSVAGMDTSRHPVEMVSWNDAQEFCARLSTLPEEQKAERRYQLPTESQWEYAGRAGTTTKWACGDDENALAGCSWYKDNSGGTRHAVGTRKPNGFGLFDMYGNVWEWCGDRSRRDWYALSPTDDPLGPSDSRLATAVVRGACIHSTASNNRSAVRFTWAFAARYNDLGFRVAVNVVPESAKLQKNGAPANAVKASAPPARAGIAPSLVAVPVSLHIPADPRTWTPGAPISSTALVTRPAPFPGVKSWTLETLPWRERLETMRYSPDGKLIAGVGNDGTVRIFSSETGRLVRALVASPAVLGLSWSPCGRYLATGSRESAIRLWEVGSGKLLQTVWVPNDIGYGFAWSPDGKRLAYRAQTSLLVLFDLETRKAIKTVDDGVSFVENDCLAWSPDGRTVAANAKGASLALWDAANGAVRLTLPLERDARSCAWSPDGSTLAVGVDGSVQLWNVSTGKRVRECKQSPRGRLHFSADGKVLTFATRDAAGDLFALRWEVGSEKPPSPQSMGKGARWFCDWSPDGLHAVIWGRDGVVRIADLESGKAIDLPRGDQSDALTMFVPVAWSRGARRFAITEPGSGRTHVLVDTNSTTTRHSVDVDARGLAWSSDGSQLAICEPAATSLYSADLGQRLHQFQNPQSRPRYVAWSPSGTHLALCHTEKREPAGVEIVEVASGKGVTLKTDGGANLINSAVAWSPDGTQLAAFAGRDKVFLWDTRNGTLLRTFSPPEEDRDTWAPPPLLWSPDGRLLATGVVYGRSFVVWKTTTGDVVLKHALPNGGIGGSRCIAFSPDSTRLAVGSGRDQSLVWDLATNKRVNLRGSKTSMNGAHAVAFSEDGKSVALINWLNTIDHFDLASQRLIATYGSNLPPGYHTRVSPCNTRFAAVGWGMKAFLRDIATGKPIMTVTLANKDILCVSPDGHYQTTLDPQKDLLYVVETDAGQETLTPDEFAKRFGWKNDSSKVSLQPQGGRGTTEGAK